ncbi:hypothetical protein [Cytobacillus luteolus]|nr:hypothetical protein [Cytobacillus luteolus]MBP1943977.1 hypothetical protein [Cytobacillus luteolus]
MENLALEKDSTPKELLFEWDKHLSYLTLNKIKTKVTIDNPNLFIERRNHYLGLVPGRTKDQKLPLSNIAKLSVRKKINLFDILLGLTFIILGFAQPLFFIFAIITFWTGVSNKVIITTNLKSKFIIPTNSKENAQQLIEAINEIPVSK